MIHVTAHAIESLWCVLRCPSSKTLDLAKALNEVGFRAWAPSTTAPQRVGKSRKRDSQRVAVLPGWAFAPYSQAVDLLTFSRSPSLLFQVWDAEQRRMVTKGCPHFSVFREHGLIAWVRDKALDPLRLSEQQVSPKTKRPSFAIGSEVKHPANGFEGMIGEVEKDRGRTVIVCFSDPSRPGFSIPVEIDPRQLIAA